MHYLWLFKHTFPARENPTLFPFFSSYEVFFTYRPYQSVTRVQLFLLFLGPIVAGSVINRLAVAKI